MGAGNAGGTGSGGNAQYTTSREIGLTNQYTKDQTKRAADMKADRSKAFQEQGAYETRTGINNMLPGSAKVIGTVLSSPLQKGAKYNRAFFEKNVIGNTKKGSNITTTREEFDKMSMSKREALYDGYTKARQSGTKDAYGRDVIGGDGGNNTPTVIKKNIGGNTIQTTAPTEAEVSQSEAANADAAALKVKKRGRSASIMTSSKGVTKTASNYSLGKPSLLGQV